MSRIISPTNKFELVKPWEETKFDAHGNRRNHNYVPMALAMQRAVFGAPAYYVDDYSELYAPRICFEADWTRIDWQDCMPKLHVPARLAGQYALDDGYFLVIADNSPAGFMEYGFKFSWKMTRSEWSRMRPKLGALSKVILIYLDKSLVAQQWWTIEESFFLKYSESVADAIPPNTQFLYDGIDEIWYDDHSISFAMYRGSEHKVWLRPMRKTRLFEEDNNLFLRTSFTPINYFLEPQYFAEFIPMIENDKFYVETQSWASFMRLLKRRWQPKPRLEDFEVIDPEKGYLNYKAEQGAGEDVVEAFSGDQ